MQKVSHLTASLPVDTNLYFSPENNSFSVDKDCSLKIKYADPWIVLSIKGGSINKTDLLRILHSRGRRISKSRQENAPPEVQYFTVVIPIRILDIQGNKIISFQLTAPAYVVL